MKKNKIVLALIAIAAAVLFFILDRTGWVRFFIFYVFLISGTIYYIFKSFPDKKKRNFILILFAIALIARITFMLIAHLYSDRHGCGGFYYHSVNITPNDEYTYHTTAKMIADGFRKDPLFFMDKEEALSIIVQDIHFGYNLLVGLIYYICGDNLLFGKFFNCFLGALVVLYAYMIGVRFLGINPAKLGALLVAADSYAIMYSAFLYKEILLSFVFIFFTWHFLNYVKTGNKYHIIICLLAGIFGATTRIYLGGALLFAGFVYFLIFHAPREPVKRFVYVIALILIASPILYHGGSFAYRAIATGSFRSRAIGAKSGVRGGDEESANLREALSPKRVVVNLARMIFSPMPWRDLTGILDPILYVGYPGRWMWYVFIPFFAYGIYYYAYNKLKLMFVPSLALFTYLFICAVVMMSGSRHHIAIMPFMLLTSAVGFCRTKNPLWLYVIYLPLLIAFFHFDTDTLKDFIFTLAIWIGVYLVYLFFILKDKIGFDKLISVLTVKEETS